MILLLIEQEHEGKRRLISGSIVLMFGQTALWAFTGSDKDDFSLHPNDLVLWHGLHDACKRGYRSYDLGEVAENHPELARFKAKWGTELKPVYRYYYPAATLNTDGASFLTKFAMRAASQVWRRLPHRATSSVGDRIYSYL
jgi:lipid II:glycine glycyltransferase (peptidoglycan interpeptide bridge formation enzyme)